MCVSLPITFLCAVGGAYLFGVALGLGVIGVYIGFTIDECVRGTIMIVRWKTGKSEKKVLIQSEEKEPLNS